MGKAKIISHVGEGEYVIEVLHAREHIEQRIESLQNRIAEDEEKLGELESEKEEVRQALQDWTNQLLDIINQIKQAMENEAAEQQVIAEEIAAAKGLML